MQKGQCLTKIEELKKYPFIDFVTFKNIFKDTKYIKDKIKYMKKKSLLLSLKKGFYIYADKSYSKEIIANHLYAPSYISFEYALWFYSLIPEKIERVTSATTKRKKIFKTPIGEFVYKHIDKKLFSLGVEIYSVREGNFLIASKEKALCDTLFLLKGTRISSKKEMIEFLEEDLRFDIDELEDFDIGTVKKYYELSKSVRILQLLKVIDDFNK